MSRPLRPSSESPPEIIRDTVHHDRFLFYCKIVIMLAGVGMLISAAYIVGYNNGIVDGALKAFDYARTNFRCLIPFP